MTDVFGKAKPLSWIDIAASLLGLFVIYRVLRVVRKRVKTTKLRGPKPKTWLWGFTKDISIGDSSALYESWADEYGGAFEVASTMGGKRLILADPKGVAHFFANETFTYVHAPLSRNFIENIFGRGLLWSQGESHRRQRKILTPAFSNQAIKNMTPIFFDSVHKAKAAWDAVLDSSPPDGAVIEVQSWMNRISLDSVGIAGFGHDFQTLHGRRSTIVDAFESFGQFKPTMLSLFVPLLSPVLPWLVKLPTKRTRLIWKMNNTMGKIADEMLDESRRAGAKEDKVSSKSMIGALVQAENNDSQLYLTPSEMLAQMKTLILAGYETTSISLTWALIELSLHPDKQNKLREELSQLANDASYEDLTGNGFPYLDGVVREVLRLHPPVTEINRMAAVDDVIPLTDPVQTASGTKVDRISVAAGQVMLIPIKAINRSKTIWGADAWEFLPERWIGEAGLTKKALEIQGYGHILTFVDGPRTCLGRGFAVVEFKVVLSTLIRSYAFAPRDGPEMKIERARTLLPRPKLAGEEGYRVPLRVRRVE